jgi:hypothetical protein
MINIGHNNWLSVNLEKNSTTNVTDPFKVEINSTGKVMGFNDAADYTARLIAERYSNIHLCLSGGMDSEFVATVLIRNNINFTPVIILADHTATENWYAFKFCNEQNLSPLLLDYQGKENHIQLAKQIIAYAKQHSLPADRSLLVNIIAEQLPNVAVLTGYGDPVHVSADYNETIGNMVEITDHDYFLDVVNGSRHPGAFFSYTPELFYSMCREIDWTKNTQDAKTDLYNIRWRPKMHSTFFELYPSSELSYIVKHALNSVGKRSKHQAFFINRDTLLNQLTGL